MPLSDDTWLGYVKRASLPRLERVRFGVSKVEYRNDPKLGYGVMEVRVMEVRVMEVRGNAVTQQLNRCVF
ncbi:MAG: hypothetical protein GY924_07365 [Planctomycetaceae bacterium]|nr:hypothetical protein [Planctomycetaceae bacterium]